MLVSWADVAPAMADDTAMDYSCTRERAAAVHSGVSVDRAVNLQHAAPDRVMRCRHVAPETMASLSRPSPMNRPCRRRVHRLE